MFGQETSMEKKKKNLCKENVKKINNNNIFDF